MVKILKRFEILKPLKPSKNQIINKVSKSKSAKDQSK